MKVENNVKKHKKFLETIDKTDYLVEHEGNFYKVFAFYKFGIAKGYLLLHKDGEICARKTVIQPYKQFIMFNSYMINFSTIGLEEINKPTGAFKETIELLKLSMTINEKSLDEITHAISELEKLDSGFKRLREIYEEVKRVFNNLKSTGILDEFIVKQISVLMDEFTERQYEHLYLQIGLKETYTSILNEMSTSDNKSKNYIKEMRKLLKYLIEDEYQSNLKKSLIDFEKDVNGNQVSFYMDYKNRWQEKLKINSNEKLEYQFKNELLAVLRN